MSFRYTKTHSAKIKRPDKEEEIPIHTKISNSSIRSSRRFTFGGYESRDILDNPFCSGVVAEELCLIKFKREGDVFWKGNCLACSFVDWAIQIYRVDSVNAAKLGKRLVNRRLILPLTKCHVFDNNGDVYFFKDEIEHTADNGHIKWEMSVRNPIDVSVDLLSRAVDICLKWEHQRYSNRSRLKLIESDEYRRFVDVTPELQSTSVANLGSANTVIFFLNIYHTMLIHLLLRTGSRPTNLTSFLELGDTIVYNIDGYNITLSEILCCILLYDREKPKGIPKKYRKFKKNDPRSAYQKPTHSYSDIIYVISLGCLLSGHIFIYKSIFSLEEDMLYSSSLFKRAHNDTNGNTNTFLNCTWEFSINITVQTVDDIDHFDDIYYDRAIASKIEKRINSMAFTDLIGLYGQKDVPWFTEILYLLKNSDQPFLFTQNVDLDIVSHFQNRILKNTHDDCSSILQLYSPSALAEFVKVFLRNIGFPIFGDTLRSIYHLFDNCKNSLRVTFMTALEDKTINAYFKWFMKKTYCMENYNCFLDIQRYKTLPEEELETASEKIIGKYFGIVNMSEKVKVTTIDSPPNYDRFNSLERNLKNILKMDTFTRFQRSEEFKVFQKGFLIQ
eukprot:TRINITY_DN4346_c0_g1_i1.p1 TRINITY_DN4346_c0_g1~~TRINITY_DN4346_c0_g1_i1.p1  ORF type:complete len:615 (-),score=91.51 TRINITY_DN4346_c0_g1_i1:286-2130(-)